MIVPFALMLVLAAGAAVSALTGEWSLAAVFALGAALSAVAVVAVHAEDRRWR